MSAFLLKTASGIKIRGLPEGERFTGASLSKDLSSRSRIFSTREGPATPDGSGQRGGEVKGAKGATRVKDGGIGRWQGGGSGRV